MAIYFSATTCSFYDTNIISVSQMPEDKVAVSDSKYKELLDKQNAGYVIIAGPDGNPTVLQQTCGKCDCLDLDDYATKKEMTSGLALKVAIAQGVENAGKILKVDDNGNVVVSDENGGAGLPILFHTWSDAKIKDASWLCADTFSWHNGDTYKSAYESIKNGYDSLSNEVLYAYDDEYDSVLYLKTSTPSIGDQLFDENGEPANKDYGGWFVRKIYSDGSISYDPNTPDTRYYRNASKDIALSVPASTTETINGITISFYRAENGRKICLPDQESNLLTLYNSTGVAWYYILDTENKRFKLPRTKYGFTGLRDEVGNYVPESLPTHTHTRGSMNITGGFEGNELTAVSAANSNAWGAFKTYDSGRTGTSGSYLNSAGFSFDAASSWTGSTSEPDNSVYGSGKPVQQRATQMHLYFYVGNFKQSAIEQTAGLNAELFNGKADRDLNNVPSNYDYVVATQEPTSANGYTWFRKYKSGWVEQGGRTTLNNGISATNKIITFPIVMKNSSYYANVSQDANAGPQLVMHGWQSTTGMTIGTGDISATGFVEWIVSGMSA